MKKEFLESAKGYSGDLIAITYSKFNLHSLVLMCGGKYKNRNYLMPDGTPARIVNDKIEVVDGDVTTYYEIPSSDYEQIVNCSFVRKYYQGGITAKKMEINDAIINSISVGNPDTSIQDFVMAIGSGLLEDVAYNVAKKTIIQIKLPNTLVVVDYKTGDFIKSFALPDNDFDLLDPDFVQHFIEDDRSYVDVVKTYTALKGYRCI